MAIENQPDVAAMDVVTSAATEQYLAVKQALSASLNKSLGEGETWYLIDSHWFKQLRKYLHLNSNNNKTDAEVGDSNGVAVEVDASANPGPIDNGPLFNEEEPGEIRLHLMDELDYVLVPEEVWELLVRHFGMTEGQEPIARQVVENGMFVKHFKVEVYKHEFQLAEESDPSKTIKMKFSKVDTLATIVSEMRKLFEIPEEVGVRLWVKYSKDTIQQLQNMDSTVQDSPIYPGQLILIERQNEDGSWPRPNSTHCNFSSAQNCLSSSPDNVSPVTSSNSVNDVGSEGTPEAAKPSTSVAVSGKGSSIMSRRPTDFNSLYVDTVGGTSAKTQPGLCGLSNLGNTCFMNSIIQGLSNTPAITEYFACDNHIEDINEENPLGMKGEIAKTFGELIKSMWSGRCSYVVPRNFKTAVGRFAPQFSGYQQQDSQELLTFLLDGLHEDLNRVKKKPYIEIKDSAGRPDEEVAAEAWEVYKKRNDSVILDLFHGLLKSTVVCPECPKISVTFDPFCHLSLPLPVRKERVIEVFLVYQDQSKCPTQYKVTCPKNGCMKDLCNALSALSGVDADRMVATDVYGHRFHKIYNPGDGLHHILERDDIFVYEVPTTDVNHPEIIVMPVYLREKKTSMSYSPSSLFGQPLLLGLPRGVSYESLYQHVLNSISRCVNPPPEGSTWWKTEPEPAVNGDNVEDGVEAKDETNTDDELMAGEEKDSDKRGPPKIFIINNVNALGSAQVKESQNNAEPVIISTKHYLSLDWHPKAKQLFYNEKAAEDAAQDKSYHTKPVQKTQSVNLRDCLELYTTREKLGENNTWRCPSCKKDQQATKKFDLWSLPGILVISLKRFSFNRYWRDKLDTQVEFPVYGLDMSPYIINKNHGSAVYDLIAVSNHYGGMGGGHYTAYAKNKDDGKWYYFDDSSVTPSSEDSVVTKAAYVLFYQRRDLSKFSAESALTNGRHNAAAGASSEEDMDVN